MANILEKIVADTRSRIDALKQSFPLATFKSSLQPSKRCIYQALSQDAPGFILECKKASPSKGLIRPDFDIKQISQTYFNYAAAISVLTDEKYFQGSYDYLQTVAEQAPCPVLNKDFFVDVYQVYLARHYGADAILLMLSVLTDTEYRALASVAKTLNLGILTEISTVEERDRAIALDAKLIGINNRNLRDLSTDLTRTFELVQGIPADRLVISESGIYTNAQVRQLAPAVNGFLVGSSLMAQENLDIACRQLIFGNNKVCGLKDESCAQAAIQAGAVYGGLIFAESSPRYVSQQQAEKLAKLPLKWVGVFVNETIPNVVAKAKSLALSAVQLHGQEDVVYVAALRAHLPKHCQIWKAYPIGEAVPPFDNQAEVVVLDGRAPGSGQPFNWQVLAKTPQSLAQSLLAGGIGPDNIADAYECLIRHRLFGLDLNSGVEMRPGKKDPKKLQQVFNRLRQYK